MAADSKRAELERIRRQHGGTLRPVDVVSAAKSKSSPLHSYFEWDDGKAAHQHRLEQARLLIRCTVELVGGDERPVKMYVSLQSKRSDGDSYQSLKDVIRTRPLREELLRQALAEADAWRKRYEKFAELQEVFAAIGRAITKIQVAPKKRTRKRQLAVA